jgi:hypothetical protein
VPEGTELEDRVGSEFGAVNLLQNEVYNKRHIPYCNMAQSHQLGVGQERWLMSLRGPLMTIEAGCHLFVAKIKKKTALPILILSISQLWVALPTTPLHNNL